MQPVHNAAPTATTWITVHQAAALTGVPESRWMERRQTCRRGDSDFEVPVTELPLEAQLRYWQSLASGVPIVAPETTEVAASSADQVSEKGRRIALKRRDLVRLYVDETDTGYGGKVERKKYWLERYNAGALPELREELGNLSYPTIERWRKSLEESGWDWQAVVPSYGVDGKQEKTRAVTTMEAEVLLSFALTTNKLRESEVIRLTRAELDRRGIVVTASDMTLRRWLQDYKRDHYDKWIFAREGDKGLNDKALPYVQRDRWSVEAGDLVTADGHTLNFDIINPATGKPKRMALIMVYDWRSGYPLGWVINSSENTVAISAAYRRAVLRLGYIPRVFYLDNGRAFRAKYFKGSEDFRQSGIKGLFERLGTEVTHAHPYHGQSKSVERWFGTFSELERMLPSYRGTSIDQKPAHLSRGETFHRRLREELEAVTALTLTEAYSTITAYLDDLTSRPQTALRGASPIDVLTESIERIRQTPDFTRRMVSPEELNLLMMAEKKTAIYRNGIRHEGGFYWHEKFFALEKGKDRHDFTIRYDLLDPSTILVYDRDGRLYCRAERKGLHHPAAKHLGTQDDRERLAAELEEKQHLITGTRHAVKGFLLEQNAQLTETRSAREIIVPEPPKITEEQPNERRRYALLKSDIDDE